MKLKTILCSFFLSLISPSCCYFIANKIKKESYNIENIKHEIKDQTSIKIGQRIFKGYVHEKRDENIIQISNVLKKRNNAITIHIKKESDKIKQIYANEETFLGISNKSVDFILSYPYREKNTESFKSINTSKPVYFYGNNQKLYIGQDYRVNVFNRKRLTNYYEIPLELNWVIRNKFYYNFIKMITPLVYIIETIFIPIELIIVLINSSFSSMDK